jgi:transposase
MDTNTKAAAQRYSRGPYKRHPVAFKRAVVEASLAPGASVSRVAREHNINANQVFLWVSVRPAPSFPDRCDR